MDPRLLQIIKNKAAEDTCHERNPGYSAYEGSGGNYDDAFYSGTQDGEIYFARELLKLLKE